MTSRPSVALAVRAVLGSLTRRERAGYVVILVLRALVGLLDVAGIAVIGIIASVAASRLDPTEGPLEAFGFVLPTIDERGILILVGSVLALFVAKALLAVLLVRGQAYFIAQIETRVADRLATFLLSGGLLEARRHSKAEVQFTLTGSTTYTYTGLLNNVATLVAEGFLLLVIVATLLVVNPTVSIFTLVYFALVVVVIQGFIGPRVKRAAEHAVEGTISTTNSVSDILDAFREITVLGKREVYTDSVRTSRARIARSNAAMTYLAGMPRYVVETALILGVVVLVAQQFLSGGLADGLVTIGVFLAGGVRMMSSLLPLQTALANIRNNAEQARPALELLARTHAGAPVVESAESPVVDDPDHGLGIAVRNVSFSYPGGAGLALDDVSLEVSGGDYVAIVGPSGAGKTTLVDLLLGLIEPDEGVAAIGGLSAQELRTANAGLVAYVPQRPGIASGTIAQNIALGIDVDAIDRERLDSAIDSAFLRSFVDGLPHGVDTSVGKQADALSGGQIQRIGVARALYTRPRLIVLDEATSGLDASSEDYVGASLRALHGEVTVVVIAHRLSTVQHADRVFVVEDGRIVAAGDFATVRRDVPMIAEYVKLMSFQEPEEEEA